MRIRSVLSSKQIADKRDVRISYFEYGNCAPFPRQPSKEYVDGILNSINMKLEFVSIAKLCWLRSILNLIRMRFGCKCR